MSRLRALENVLDRAGYPRGAVVGNVEEAKAMLIARLQEMAGGRSPHDEPEDDDDHEVIEGDPVGLEG